MRLERYLECRAKCLASADDAETTELTRLWLSVAQSYHVLIESETRRSPYRKYLDSDQRRQEAPAQSRGAIVIVST